MKGFSFKKVNRAALAERRTLKKTVLITLILYIIAAVLIAFSEEGGMVIGCMLGFGGLACGFITSLLIFKDLNNKQFSDVSLSLPMTGTERFCTRILTYLYVQALPLFISAVICSHISLLTHYNIWHRNFTFVEVYGEIWASILTLMSAAIFMFAIVALCASCSGTIAETTYFSILIALLQAGLPILFLKRIFETSSGIDWVDSHTMIFNFWGAGIFNAMENSSMAYMAAGAAINIGISIVMLVITNFIYKKRDARVVGTPVANKVFFEVMMISGVFIIYLMLFFSDAYLWGVLIAGICYLIINIVVSRKKINASAFAKWTVKFAGMSVLFLVVMSLAIVTGGFGYIHTQPTSNMDQAECSFKLANFGQLSSNKTRHELQATDLTDEQCREILDIYQKHLKAGKPGLEALTHADYDYYYGTEKVDKIRCIVRFKFDFQKKYEAGCTKDYEYDKDGYERKEYSVFTQSLSVDVNEAEALYDELEKLSYLHVWNNTVQEDNSTDEE